MARLAQTLVPVAIIGGTAFAASIFVNHAPSKDKTHDVLHNLFDKRNPHNIRDIRFARRSSGRNRIHRSYAKTYRSTQEQRFGRLPPYSMFTKPEYRQKVSDSIVEARYNATNPLLDPLRQNRRTYSRHARPIG